MYHTQIHRQHRYLHTKYTCISSPFFSHLRTEHRSWHLPRGGPRATRLVYSSPCPIQACPSLSSTWAWEEWRHVAGPGSSCWLVWVCRRWPGAVARRGLHFHWSAAAPSGPAHCPVPGGSCLSGFVSKLDIYKKNYGSVMCNLKHIFNQVLCGL